MLGTAGFSLLRISLFICIFLELFHYAEPKTDLKHEEYEIRSIREPGDITIGGLFPIHEDGMPNGRHCGRIYGDKGLQRLEAMLYAVDEINRSRHILNGIKLGVHVRDTCSQETHALEQTLDFIKSSVSNDYAGQCGSMEPKLGGPGAHNPTEPVVAVIGAAASKVSMNVANMLGLFKIPQISYSSTTVELSDKSKYEYFSRVVPPDNIQARAMVDIIEKMGWSYVSAIVDGDPYGEKGLETFQKLAAEKGICIAALEKVLPNYQESDFVQLIQRISHNDYQYARGVIMFVSDSGVIQILRAIRFLGLTGRFFWVASDSWGKKRTAVRNDPETALGAVTIQPKTRYVQSFDNYFVNLTPNNNVRNVWFQEYWRQQFGCNSGNDECMDQSGGHHMQEDYVPFVIEAVYLLATALDELIKDNCQNVSYTSCSIYGSIDGSELLNYIRNVTFYGVEGNPIRLDQHGDNLRGMYEFYQFRKQNETYVYQKIGEWNAKSFSIDLDMINDTWNGELPTSVCSKPCAVGELQKRQPGSCCWVCVDCGEFNFISNQSCVPCDLGKIPLPDKNGCVDLEVETMEWLSAWALLPACFSVVGICLTLFVSGVFLRYRTTPIIMASGRELCYMMQLGILLSYTVTLLLMVQPGPYSCASIRVLLGLSLCICYAAILTRTSRLARIFTSDIKSLQKPRFVSPMSQLVICNGIISLQLCGALLWVVLDPPAGVISYPERGRAVLTCGFVTDVSPLILSQAYNMLLIVLCTVFAVKTRNIPENFNETKHIGFTMYSTCIVWLAFIPIYSGTSTNFKVQTTSLALCMSICATVCLLCFFAPKVFVVLLKPHKNVRLVRQKTPMTANLQKLQFQLLRQQMLASSPALLQQISAIANSAGIDEMSLFTLTTSQNSGQLPLISTSSSSDQYSSLAFGSGPQCNGSTREEGGKKKQKKSCQRKPTGKALVKRIQRTLTKNDFHRLRRAKTQESRDDAGTEQKQQQTKQSKKKTVSYLEPETPPAMRSKSPSISDGLKLTVPHLNRLLNTLTTADGETTAASASSSLRATLSGLYSAGLIQEPEPDELLSEEFSDLSMPSSSSASDTQEAVEEGPNLPQLELMITDIIDQEGTIV